MEIKRFLTGMSGEVEKKFVDKILNSSIYKEVEPYLDPDTSEVDFKILTNLIDNGGISESVSGYTTYFTKVEDCAYIMNETVVNRIFEPDTIIYKENRVILVVADEVMKITLIPNEDNEEFYESIYIEFINKETLDLIPREILMIPTEV